jgi:hypothetical protein
LCPETVKLGACITTLSLGTGFVAHIQLEVFRSVFLPVVIVSSKILSTMPRQREKSPQRPKLSAREMRVLIKQYGIRFRGLLSPSQWPRGHSEIFTRVRQIRLIEFDEYKPDETTDRGPMVNELKNCAFTLVSVAMADRKKRANEFTLRMSTEPLVFKRFKEEMKWCESFSIKSVTSCADLSITAKLAANSSGYLNFRRCLAIRLKQAGCKDDVPRGRSASVLQIRGFGRMGINPTLQSVVPNTD